MATPAPESDKVEKRSVSFSPGSLAEWADQFGDKQEPKLSFSAVICTALKEFRQRHEPTTDEAQLIVAARKVGISKALAAIASLRRPSKRATP
jgi:hypothetical protein